MRRLVLLALIPLALVAAGCGSSSKKSSAGTKTTTQAQSTSGGCKDVQQPPARDPGKHSKPAAALDASKQWTLNVQTSCGNFTIALDLKSAPKAAASMVALARSGYFKNTSFHRIVPGFVIQGGDPTGTGQGGPGYSTVDKPPSGARYTHGVVAMAKTQTEAPGTGGSQFFVVTGSDAGLPPEYAVLGKVTLGLDVVDKIGQLGNSQEQPTQPVVIDNVVVASR